MKKSQVTLTVRLKAKPAMGGRLEEIARGLLTPTRQEPGCIDYYFHVNSKTPNEFLFYALQNEVDALNRTLGLLDKQDVECAKLALCFADIALTQFVSGESGADAHEHTDQNAGPDDERLWLHDQAP